MTARERVIAAVDFAGPDRVPLRHCALPAAFAAHPWLPALYAKYRSDFTGNDPIAPTEMPLAYRVGRWTDAWGCEWTVAKEGLIGQVTGHPLADLADLPAYRLPPVEADWSAPPGPLPRVDERYLQLGSLSLFERMVSLCGFENVLLALGSGDARLLRLRDLIVERNLRVIAALLSADPDCLGFSDDWGSQLALLIAPAMWRELFLPSYRRQFEPIRAAGKHVYFHTDGATLSILPDLATAGVNLFWADLALNPLADLRRVLGGKACFQALTDVQFILPHGTPGEVRQHGRDILAALGSFDGGVIACTEVAADQPRANVEAIYEVFCAEGEYPLRWVWDDAAGKAVAK